MSEILSKQRYHSAEVRKRLRHVAKIRKDSETAIEKDVDNSVKIQFSLQGNSMSAKEQRIVDEAKANGTYLKTLNGKASNLNERQWIQVRR